MVKDVNKEVTVGNLLSKYSDVEICDLIDVLQEYRKQKTELGIPISIFSNPELGILESAVKFLKENHSMSYAAIAKALNRDQRTIWCSYHSANNKEPSRLPVHKTTYLIPILVISERKFGPLEALVVFLRDNQKLRFTEISHILRRDYATIWRTYRNTRNTRGQDV
ncbi:MAG: hypothetical protein V1837_04740 [Candidatus Woesearchaeota archaeon]